MNCILKYAEFNLNLYLGFVQKPNKVPNQNVLAFFYIVSETYKYTYKYTNQILTETAVLN